MVWPVLITMTSSSCRDTKLSGPVTDEYFGGLVDGAGRFYYDISASEGAEVGYTIRPRLRIRTSQVANLSGLVDDVLQSNGLQYRFGQNAVMHIDSPKAITKLFDRINGCIVDLAPEFSFVCEELIPAMRSGIESPARLLSLAKTGRELEPEMGHDTKNYTLEELADQFDRSAVPVSRVEFPKPNYPDRLSTEYMGGFIDANRKVLFLQIGKSNQHEVGYSLNPAFNLFHSHPTQLFEAHLKAFFSDHEIEISIDDRQNGILMRVNDNKQIDKFIRTVFDHLWLSFPIARFFYEKMIPAHRDGYHHTKPGFLDLLEAYEKIHQEVYGEFSDRREYSSGFFKEQWPHVR
jgi:hypothetical protein